ncbi:hypothetical protein [Acetivibrio cellulolyticus]|uniref:hypothetical protein n=1 Tax=Acetivibrio cellulolyticus TaxID=35830 RepID=UPI0001E2F64F|nr:hypothetical protein [Acetivibrio cellulolyticus]
MGALPKEVVQEIIKGNNGSVTDIIYNHTFIFIAEIPWIHHPTPIVPFIHLLLSVFSYILTLTKYQMRYQFSLLSTATLSTLIGKTK